MVARHQPPPTVDVVRLRVTPTAPDPARHPSALAGFVATLIDVTCDTYLLACARNAVLNEVSGDWVVFVDGGVDVESRWIERLGRDLERASARPTVACSVGSAPTSPLSAVRPALLDVAYRRSALDLLGPFADTTDATLSDTWTMDLEMQLRLLTAGLEVQRGDRVSR